ncbi:hypothetical protein Pth03_53710 [Planotetraspora thailandica]|uniref:Protein kinase domain-containing protein n=1 Tax=Planotetraspora thailandica TaxID=487172 RepID=A0A8J3V7P4_9ACTN|nr:hypothetical protein Pth03_53710 [Planotetraspora thailandica]
MQPLRTDDPQLVGPYRLVGLIGEGGQGAVYRGVDEQDRPVAVKLLHARFSGDAKARSRFAAELAHAGRVAAFCTARVLDADAEGDRPYIVSEFVDGPSLAQVISEGGTSSGPALERLAIATVTALAAIHEAGIVHRDFKPSNVIMGVDGPRVIDFGIARALDATGTLSSAVVGTPAFMAPEQIGGQTVGPPADVFAWGCTIACAANGVTPFGQDSIPAVMHRILTGEPDLGGLSGQLRDIVASCLAKDPARRPTARQILLRLLGGTDATGDTLLTEGARAATLPITATLPVSSTEPVSGMTTTPDETTKRIEESPTTPLGREPASDARPSAARRTAARMVVIAAGLLGATTALPWGEVGMLHDGMSMVLDTVGVPGIATPWGIATLVMALAAVAVGIADEFGRRLSAAWALVPGAAAIVSAVIFRIRQDDLHTHQPLYGMLAPDDLREFNANFHISVVYGWYAAIALAVLLAVLGLICLRLRRS